MYDLNELLFREQTALARARRANSAEMRRVYSNMAARYRASIAARPFYGSALIGAGK